MNARPPCSGVLALLALLAALYPSDARAQSEVQLWGDVDLKWIKSHDWTLGAEIEPKVLVSKPSDDPGWATLDVTPSVEYTRGNWVDVVGELLVARTRQTDDEESTEITPRVGLRLHILSNLENRLFRERLPKRRLVLRDFVRFEWRNLYYSDDQPDSSTFRARNRVELLYPLNRPRITDNGALYATGDVEWFWTAKNLEERYSSKERIRVGIGHRRSRAWRFEALYVWDRSRQGASGFTKADSAVDIRIHRVW